MDKAMVLVIFLIGIVLVVVSIRALFKRIFQGSASFEWKGLKISGAGAPCVFLLAGVGLLLGGREMYHNLNQVAVLKTSNANLTVERNNYADAAAKLYVKQQLTENQLARAAAASHTPIEPPPPSVALSPRIMDEIEKRSKAIQQSPAPNE